MEVLARGAATLGVHGETPGEAQGRQAGFCQAASEKRHRHVECQAAKGQEGRIVPVPAGTAWARACGVKTGSEAEGRRLLLR